MTKTVLVVEDNELNMKLFHDLLEASGYNILQTRNGLEAIDIAREHRPDLILMDIQLPEVSGLEVTKWIKEDDDLRSIPVIAVTGTAANVAGIFGGIIVFGDPLSGHPLTLLIECLAFSLVVVAAWLTPAPVRARGGAPVATPA